MDKPLIRFTLSLPLNRNTLPNIDELLTFIKNNFGGCTFSRFHFLPLELDNKEIQGYFLGKFESYEDEELCFIIFDVDPVKFQNVYGDTSKLVKDILDFGEEVTWLTYHDIKLCS